jgi:murein DD-endopeptidase
MRSTVLIKILFRSLLPLVIFISHSTKVFSQSACVEMRLALAPETILVDGNPTAYLEYFITNISNDTLRLKMLALTEGGTSKIITSLDSNDFNARLRRLKPSAKGHETVMPPGTASILYLELAVGTGKSKERFISALAYEVLNGKQREAYTLRDSFYVKTKSALVLGPPLREGTWAAVYDPSWERGHRRVLYAGDSALHLPGRFAIDFIKVDGEGRYAEGNEDEIKNWYGYGADVLAVNDGTVASVRNDFPESATLSAHRQPGQDDATGNYVSITIGKGQVAFYEHLKPGSIRVQAGQHVKKGDVIASLGFTGQSTGPHLHFHVADRNAPLRAEGIPFVFERFKVLGAYTDMGKFGKEIWSPVTNANQFRKRERPVPNAVIVFQ